MAEITVLDAVHDALEEEMAQDKRVILVGEDVGRMGGVFHVTDGLLSRFGEERVVDAPIAESAIVGICIGAAVNGLRPVAEIQFADFIYPAVDQIISEAAKLRYRTNGSWGCPIVIRAPYGGGTHGGPYHSQNVEGIFFGVPGLKIVMPATPYDTKGLLKAAIRDEDPVLFFEHKKTYRSVKEEVPEGDYIVPLGKAKVRRLGTDITLVTYGLMVHDALEAAEVLAVEGTSVEVIDLRTVKPMDTEAVLESVRKTNKVLILYEDNLTGGVGAEIAALIAEHAFEHLDAPIVRVAAPDIPAMPYSTSLEHFAMPDPVKTAAALRKLAAY